MSANSQDQSTPGAPGATGWPSRLERQLAEAEWLAMFQDPKYLNNPRIHRNLWAAATLDEGKFWLAMVRHAWDSGVFDKNNDGRVNLAEFLKLFGISNVGFGDGAYGWLMSYFANVDKQDGNKDGVIGYSDFLKFQAYFILNNNVPRPVVPWDPANSYDVESFSYPTGEKDAEGKDKLHFLWPRNEDGLLVHRLDFRFAKEDVKRFWLEHEWVANFWYENGVKTTLWCKNEEECEKEWALLKKLEDEVLDTKTPSDSTVYQALFYYMGTRYSDKPNGGADVFFEDNSKYLTLFDGESERSVKFYEKFQTSPFSPKNKVDGMMALELVKATWRLADKDRDSRGVAKLRANTLSLEEFTALMQNTKTLDVSQESEEIQESYKTMAEEMFAKFDVDNEHSKKGFLAHPEYIDLQMEYMEKTGMVLTYWSARKVLDKLCDPVEENGWGLWNQDIKNDFSKTGKIDKEITFDQFVHICCVCEKFFPEEKADEQWRKTGTFPDDLKFFDLVFFMNTHEHAYCLK